MTGLQDPMPEYGYEFRVKWQRDGQRPKTKIYQARAAAERWALIVQGRLQEVTGDDPDDYACCSGSECGCRGVTNEQAWADQSRRIPALVSGPEIEQRWTGSWVAAALSPERGGPS